MTSAALPQFDPGDVMPEAPPKAKAPRVTVAIPVGPFPACRRWLAEAIESVLAQTHQVDELLVIDDMAGLSKMGLGLLVTKDGPRLTLWTSPWRLGVAHAFNFGVAIARNDLVFMLGSDDRLGPLCIEKCVQEWEHYGRADAYYYVGVEYTDGREDPTQTLPCNAAMVTKGLWRQTGGFAVESASGAPDAALVSALMVHAPEMLRPVAGGEPLYYYRPHEETDTAMRGPWQGIVLETRSLLTRLWEAPKWGRFV